MKWRYRLLVLKILEGNTNLVGTDILEDLQENNTRPEF